MLTGVRTKNLHDYDWPDQIALLFVVSWKMVDYQTSKSHIALDMKLKANTKVEIKAEVAQTAD